MGALAVWPARTAAVMTTLSFALNVSFHSPRLPRQWEAVNTSFGGVAHGNIDPIADYADAQWIQEKALSTGAKVLIFPETVVPTWTPAIDTFSQQTLDRLRASGKTILVGTRIPVPSHDATPSRYDFSADLAALGGEQLPMFPTTDSRAGHRTEAWFPYDNALIVRRAETGVVQQRIPVPIGMWNPLKAVTAHLYLHGSGVIDLHGQRVAVLICYEQLLTWPVLISMAQRPTVLVGVANDYWVAGTPIPSFQLAAVRAWARLFRLPYLCAVNT
jgi:apolipoprotein N-acyltransferase